MNEVEAIKRGVAPVQEEITNSDTPHTITGYTASSLNVINNDASTALVLVLTHDNSETTTITIPANTTWSDQVRFTSAIASSGSTDFRIQIKGWDPNDQ